MSPPPSADKLSAETACNYVVGQLVWAKMKHYPPYPAKIVDEETVDVLKTTKRPKKSVAVEFFPAGNYSFIPTVDLSPFFRDLLYRRNLNKTPNFKKAIDAVEKYIEENPQVRELEPDATAIDDKKLGLPFPQAEVSSEGPANKLGKKRKRNPKIGINRNENGQCSETDTAEEESAAIKKVKTEQESEDKINDCNSLTEESASVTADCDESATSETVTEREFVETVEARKQRILVKPQVKISLKSFGFLGTEDPCGFLVENLTKSGHKVTVCCPENEKEFFTSRDAQTTQSIKDLTKTCDIIVSCLSGEKEIVEAFTAEEGLLSGLDELSGESSVRGYVQLSTVSRHFAESCSERLSSRNAKYLEAPWVGSLPAAQKGKLIFLCSGDRWLFSECNSFFRKTGNACFYFGDQGTAWTFKAAIDMIRGAVMSSLSEALGLIVANMFNPSELCTILKESDICCQLVHLFSEKLATTPDLQEAKVESVLSVSKSLKAAVAECSLVDIPCPVAATCSENLKGVIQHGYGCHDVSSMVVSSNRETESNHPST